MGEKMKHLFNCFFSVFLSFFLGACTQNEPTVVQGTLIMGHEVRSFVPDNQTKDFWVIDKSDNLYKAYLKTLSTNNSNYEPVTAILKVIELPKMQDGFGAEYDGTYDVVEIISLTPKKK